MIASRLVSCFVLIVATVPVLAQQPPRIAEDAVLIRAFRLNDAHLSKLRQVAATLSRTYKPAPERPRADAAMFTVLSMRIAFNEPFRDATVAETAGVIDSGHLDLRGAIHDAGLTTTEYVLTNIALLVAVPAVVGEKAGHARPADVAAENLEFVRRHWSDIMAIWSELRAATGQ